MNETGQETTDNRPADESRKKKTGRAGAYLGGLVTGAFVSCVIMIIISFVVIKNGGALVSSGNSGTEQSTGSAINDTSTAKLQRLENMISSEYYYSDDVTTEQKQDGLYKGLLESLGDKYSEYYDEDEYSAIQQETAGVFYGIGAYVSWNDKYDAPAISGTMKDGPAEKAGLLAGDIIYKVDGEETVGSDLDTVVSKIHGDEGTNVHLTVYREGETDYLEFDITRAKVDTDTVSYGMQDDNIGYIAIEEFDDVTADQFKTALQSLEDDGMKALIIDLRGNPGGNVTTVTEIAEQLLPKGLIFYYEERGGKRTDYNATGDHEFKLPLAVLVNEYSASASEILAGAIQDSGIGTIIGTQTYGKGVVQTVFSLGDGTGVKITTAAYYTRNGRSINHEGITPDTVLEFDSDAYKADGTDNQFDKAVEIMEKEM